MIRAFLVGLSAGLLLTVAGCGGTKPACTASTCSGCCDASGTCQPGSDALACGSAGFTCVACSAGQTCTFGTCITPGGSGGGGATGGGGGATGGGGGATGGGGGATGGGGGATGGGGGATGGGGGTCRTLGVFTEQQTVGQYLSSFFASAEARTSATGTFNALLGAVLMVNGGQVPGTGDLALPANQSPNSAQYYAAYGENCTTSGGSSTCAATYVGVSGTLQAVDLLGTPDAGLFSVQFQNVRFQRTGDGGVPDFSGDCVFLANEAYTATWP